MTSQSVGLKTKTSILLPKGNFAYALFCKKWRFLFQNECARLKLSCPFRWAHPINTLEESNQNVTRKTLIQKNLFYNISFYILLPFDINNALDKMSS